MNSSEILLKLNDIFKEVLDEEDVIITLTTTIDDVEEWDSLTHIQIISAIEKIFKVKFTPAEIQSFKNIKDIQTSISNQINDI